MSRVALVCVATRQIVEVVAGYDRLDAWEEILRMQERGAKVIVFCSTERMCDQLVRSLDRSFGLRPSTGYKTQQERDHVLSQFRAGAYPTRLWPRCGRSRAGREGHQVRHQFDFPTGEDYGAPHWAHGAAGATGTASHSSGQQDAKYARNHRKVLVGAGQVVPPELQQMAMMSGNARLL